MRKEKSVKKINLCFLAIITILNASLGVFGSNFVYAEEYSFVPTGGMFELSAGQAQNFSTIVNTEGVGQALDSLDSQTTCQEKVCVCKYQVHVVTLKLRDDEMIEQIGTSDSATYDCRDIKGGVGPTEVPYGISIAEPGSNYYVNISQIVSTSTEGATFGANGVSYTIGGLEVHQINVVGTSVAEDETQSAAENLDKYDEEELNDEDTEPVDEETAEDSETEESQSGLEFEITDNGVGLDDLNGMLAEEASNTFTIKVGDGVILNPIMLGAVKDSGKNLSIRRYQDDQILYEWKIKNSAINVTRDFDPTVSFSADEQAEIDQALSELEVNGEASKMYFSTMQDGSLPDGTKLRMLVDSEAVNGAERLNLYNYDSELGEVEVAYESIKVNNGYAEFAVARGSNGYFLTPAQIVVVAPEEVAATVSNDGKSGSSWIFVGILGIGGAAILGVVGFWFWKKYKVKSAAMGRVQEDTEYSDVEEDSDVIEDGSLKQDVPIANKAVMMRDSSVSVMTRGNMQLQKVQPVSRAVVKNSRKVMDMVRKPGAMQQAKKDEVTIKGSPKRLVIS